MQLVITVTRVQRTIWMFGLPYTQIMQRIVTVLKEFGFDLPELTPGLFLQENKIIRMGNPPVRLEIVTSISGVEFEDSYDSRVIDNLDGVEVSIIGLHHLKTNKKSAGRLKDLADLENLP